MGFDLTKLNTAVSGLTDWVKAGFTKQAGRLSTLESNQIIVATFATLPTTNKGPVLLTDLNEIWTWYASAYYTGYRAMECGEPVLSARNTNSPRHLNLDGSGGISKTTYAALWGFAQEQSLVVASGAWVAGDYHFVDLGGDNFRLPDLRNTFFRATGTNADTSAARAIGSSQADAIRSHTHNVQIRTGTDDGNWMFNGGFESDSNTDGGKFATDPTGGAETRPFNTAFAPRIHI